VVRDESRSNGRRAIYGLCASTRICCWSSNRSLRSVRPRGSERSKCSATRVSFEVGVAVELTRARVTRNPCAMGFTREVATVRLDNRRCASRWPLPDFDKGTAIHI
jgi:hypothetical protein